jgi:polyribonucleotide nucleotidyltransferase
MFNIQTTTVTLPGLPPIKLETGKLARQADGAVLLTCGDVQLLATVVAARDIKPDVDFLPLTVEYQEKFAGAGKIPGGFLKREMRPNDHEVLTSRIVDRSLRPLFPEDYHAEIQLVIQALSLDGEIQPDALATLAGSTAINISDIPFEYQVSSARVIWKDGQYHINPTHSQSEGAQLDLIVSGHTRDLCMVEGEALEVSEDIMLGALKAAHEAIKQLNAAQLELRGKVGVQGYREYDKPVHHADVEQRVIALGTEKLWHHVHQKQYQKHERGDNYKKVRTEVFEALKAEFADRWEAESLEKYAKVYFSDLQWTLMRKMVLDEKNRLDGRTPTDIRQIVIEPNFVPRAHGSALFTRGETQSLTSVTFGTKLDDQIIDQPTKSGFKKFMLQYRFPPFSTGEAKPLRGPGRREIGHGNLAERAVKNLVPADNAYTIRITSEILESNGSSSMATVCASSLAMMDAGVKLPRHISGIAMGMITEGSRYVILTDILGDEDHLGDMDFKVCGTRNGITACQMDMKIDGLSYDVLAEALQQAKQARLHIIEKMEAAQPSYRGDLKPFVPRMERLEVPSEFIGAIIGKGGEVIQGMQRETGAVINIEEDTDRGVGIVTISSANADSLLAARERIEAITTVPEVGQVYKGKVVLIRESGAFVEILPGKDAYLHISEVAWERIPTIDDVLKKGDIIDVEYMGIDPKNGKPRVSRKRLLPKPEGYVERPPREDRGDGDRGGYRGGDRRGGGRDDRRGGGGGRGRY